VAGMALRRGTLVLISVTVWGIQLWKTLSHAGSLLHTLVELPVASTGSSLAYKESQERPSCCDWQKRRDKDASPCLVAGLAGKSRVHLGFSLLAAHSESAH
jgi:hypothetical protein